MEFFIGFLFYLVVVRGFIWLSFRRDLVFGIRDFMEVRRRKG